MEPSRPNDTSNCVKVGDKYSLFRRARERVSGRALQIVTGQFGGVTAALRIEACAFA